MEFFFFENGNTWWIFFPVHIYLKRKDTTGHHKICPFSLPLSYFCVIILYLLNKNNFTSNIKIDKTTIYDDHRLQRPPDRPSSDFLMNYLFKNNNISNFNRRKKLFKWTILLLCVFFKNTYICIHKMYLLLDTFTLNRYKRKRNFIFVLF